MTRVKVCCIQSVAEARIAVAAGANLLGLVGPMPSGPGQNDDQVSAEIADWAPPGVGSVLLSSEVTADGLIAHVGRCRPTVLQIVDEPEAGARAALRVAHPGVKLMQVIHVEDAGAVEAARNAADADAILLDSGRPSLAVKELGGTGRVHDWAVSRRVVEVSERPVYLAGGLTAPNVGDAIRAVRPFGVDLCSGVRTEGRLDPIKLKAFMEAVRTA